MAASAKLNNQPAIRYAPFAVALVSMLLSLLYSAQRSGILLPESMSRSVQRHLDLLGGTACVVGAVGLVLSLAFGRREGGSKIFKVGVILVIIACLWSFLFQSL